MYTSCVSFALFEYTLLTKKKRFYLVLFSLLFRGKVFGKLRSSQEWHSLCGRQL
jgi:hypothetical protein